MKFEKTVLVPVDQVEDIDEAIDLVNGGVEVSSIDLWVRMQRVKQLHAAMRMPMEF